MTNQKKPQIPMRNMVSSSDSVKPAFPLSLLEAPVDERLAYFSGQRFRHPLLVQARKKLINKIIKPCGRNTINVFGPTGVGKSTLCELVQEHYTENAEALYQRTGRTAPVMLSAFAAEGKTFGWKDFYRQWLYLLVQMHPQANVDFGVRGIRRRPDGMLLIENGVSVFDLRRAAIAFTKQVRPSAVVVDEAPHIAKLAHDEDVESQMDVIKSITDHGETVLVLVGTYEMLNIINKNGQQGRRSRDIPLPRYQPPSQQEVAFQAALRTIQSHIPLQQPINLVDLTRELYLGSLGCIGILVPWIHDTLSTVLEEGRNTMTIDDLREHQDKVKLHRIALEIREGEDRMQSDKERCDRDLEALLGMKPSRS